MLKVSKDDRYPDPHQSHFNIFQDDVAYDIRCLVEPLSRILLAFAWSWNY